ncbi:MAG TPA: DUF3943 domain-containing protein [Candidatus Binatia bacterium]|nr:DUF3943 domain-containing protein [Candidatus Binatia bacterium]
MALRCQSTAKNLRTTPHVTGSDNSSQPADRAPHRVSTTARQIIFTVVFILILLPGAAFPHDFGRLNTLIGSALTERSEPITSFDKARFTLSPELRLSGTPLLQSGKSLLAQTINAPSPSAANVNLTTPQWGTKKSYLIPALEIVGFDVLLNLFDRAYFGCCDYDVDLSSIKRNLHRGWNEDRDEFTVNQLGHPYQGSMYHGFARASGLNYWQGLAYTFVGSIFWEIAGETTRPSKNDQISTGIGGTFLGEALFRISNFWLEQGTGSRFWREIVAAAISPPVGFNRLAFDQRFADIFPSKNPEYYSRMHLGVVSATQDRHESSGEIDRYEGIVDMALDYGLPGKSGYTYDRPFDYFSFQAAASTAIGFESVSTHGLLFGTGYDIGNHYRGIWGLYGGYSYMAPQIFRLASTALSLGTTGEWRVSDSLALQGTGLLGVGYASVSDIAGISNERDNHYGVAPQALLSLRLILGERASIDLTAREFFVADVSGSGVRHDNVVRADASLTWRIHREHAVSIRYQLSRRDFDVRDLGNRIQDRGTVGIFYTLLGRNRFGTGD